MCSCEEALELMSRVLDEPLTAEEQALLEAHLAACGACRALALELRALHEDMAALTEPVPEGFADAVAAKIRARGEVPEIRMNGAGTRSRRRSWRVWGGLAAALVLVAAGAARIGLAGMGASSGSAASVMSAGAAPSESPYAYSSGQEKTADASGGEESERRYYMADQMPEPASGSEPAPESAPAATPEPAPEQGWESGQISGGESQEEESALTSLGLCGGKGFALEDAGYQVLEAAIGESISNYESVGQGETPAFTATVEGGASYQLSYTGMSEDGSRYEFVLTAPDGSEQVWSAAADGSGATLDTPPEN